MIFRKLWPNSHLSWFLQFFVWFICWTILSVDFPKGTAISVHCQWTTHKLQLFLFTSCVSIALCICQVQRPRLYLCRASSVCGCRWVSKALQLNIRCTTSDESRLARVRCVCVHVSIWQTGCLSNILYVPYFEWKKIQNQQIEYSSYMECQLCWLQPIFCTVLIAMSGTQASQ